MRPLAIRLTVAVLAFALAVACSSDDDGRPSEAALDAEACAACTDGQLCLQVPGDTDVCVDECPEIRSCDGDVCCPNGATCIDGACALPNVFLDPERTTDTLAFVERTFEADACGIVDGCLGGPGTRRLMEYETRIVNDGAGPLHLGSVDPTAPAGTSACHGILTLPGFADYRILDAAGTVIAETKKDAFCVADSERAIREIAGPPRFTCDFQGISVGWADVYTTSFECQWVDVTDVPPGDYTLEIEINTLRFVEEQSFDDNVTRIPITIPPPPPAE